MSYKYKCDDNKGNLSVSVEYLSFFYKIIFVEKYCFILC